MPKVKSTTRSMPYCSMDSIRFVRMYLRSFKETVREEPKKIGRMIEGTEIEAVEEIRRGKRTSLCKKEHIFEAVDRQGRWQRARRGRGAESEIEDLHGEEVGGVGAAAYHFATFVAVLGCVALRHTPFLRALH